MKIITACLVFALLFCFYDAQLGVGDPSTEFKEVSDAIWNTGIAMYKSLSKNMPTKSIFFSPSALTSALMLLHSASKGETAQQIYNVLGFPVEINDQHNEIQNSLIGNLSLRPDTFSRAQFIFLQQGLQVQPEFQNRATQYYQTQIMPVNFDQNALQAKETMNKAFAQSSRDKLKDVIFEDPSLLNQFILANGMEMSAEWDRNISPMNTTEKTFYTATGTEVQRPMIMIRDTLFYYSDPTGTQVIEIPYAGNGVGAFFIVPNSAKSMPELEAQLSSVGIRGLLSGLTPLTNVICNFPKLALNFNYDFKPQLREMGITDLFMKDKADISNMVSGVPSLPLDNFYHQSRTTFKDEGRQVGNVPQVPAFDLNTPPRLVDINRPFVFCIIAKTTQIPLFMGRYMGD